MRKSTNKASANDVSTVVWLRARLGNIVAKILALTVGAVYVSPVAAAIRRVVAGQENRPVFPGRVALVAHAYYPDLLDEILACYSHLPTDADLIVTVPPDRLESAEKKLKGAGRLRLVAVENRGRDVAPFLTLLNQGLFEPYDVVLKLHTKKSPHLRDGEIRRKLLFMMLAGSRRRTASALRLFEDEATGLVGWGRCWRRGALLWNDNAAQVGLLCTRMGIERPDLPAFFEGTMFWVRPAAIGRIRALQLSAGDFEAEAGQTDGALHHAIERIFCLAAAAEGCVTRDMNGRLLFGAGDIGPTAPAANVRRA